MALPNERVQPTEIESTIDLPLQEQVMYLQKPFSINQMTDKTLAILNRLNNPLGQLTLPN